MNQSDWERSQEKIAVLNATSISDVWSYNPSQYTLHGSTSLVSGNLSNLALDDGAYMAFRSYFSGNNTSYFVSNDASNVDSSANKGTHSNFVAQQIGPDSTFDTLTEENSWHYQGMSSVTATGAIANDMASR